MAGACAVARGLRALVVLLLLVALTQGVFAATLLTPGVKEISQDAVTVTWGRTQDLCFASYDVQWREEGATSWATAVSVTDAGKIDYRLTGLAPETDYQVRVVDVDCVGNQPSQAVNFTTTALRPGGLTDTQFLWIGAGAVLAAVVVGLLLMRQRARRAQVESAQVLVPLDPADKRMRNCVNCGKPVATEYCGKCGTKQP